MFCFIDQCADKRVSLAEMYEFDIFPNVMSALDQKKNLVWFCRAYANIWKL